MSHGLGEWLCRGAALSALLALGGGCGSNDEVVGPSGSATQAPAVGQNGGKWESVPPLRFSDESGAVYLRQKKAEIVDGPLPQDYPVEEKTGPNGELIQISPPPSKEIDWATLPVEKIAELLRARTVRDGYEYLEEQLPIALATKVKNEAIHGIPTPATESKLPEGAVPNETKPGENTVGAPNSRYIIGSDNRVYVGNNPVYNAAQLYLEQCGCSATVIGGRIAATAAHCFFSKSKWCIPTKVAPAADGNSRPFGEWTNLSIAVPGGWDGGASGSLGLDYARIQFTTRRGDSTGWFGTITSSSGQMETVGYPDDKPRPQMWLKLGQVTTTQSDRLKHNLDVVPGDSGSAMYLQTTRQLTGIQSSQNRYSTCFFWTCSTEYWNEATRWTGPVYNFFAATGVWPG